MVLARSRSVTRQLAALLALFACSLIASPARAQADGQTDEVEKRVDKAIADYKRVRRDKKKLPQRRRLIGWLGEIDHPRVTDYLKKELVAFRKWGFGVAVIDAIGRVPRPGMERDLQATLRHASTGYAVRVAAARAIIGFGNRQADRLVEMAGGSNMDAPAAARNAAMEALARSNSPRLHRELGQLISGGDNAQMLNALRRTSMARDSAAIDSARVRCVKRGNLIVAATAWRMLAEAQHSRARELTLDVLERIVDQVDAAAAAQLVRGLVMIRDRDYYPALLRFGAVRGRQVENALKAAAPNAAKDRALMDFLVHEGIETESAAERLAAKMLLANAPPEVIRPLVERIRRDLKRNRKNVLDTAAGLHDLLARDPRWHQDLAALAATADFESRMLGLAMLLEMGSRTGIPHAQRYLSHSRWELRSLSLRYLTKSRDVTSIPLLLGRYGREDGRLAHELDKALFVHTGTRCWSRKEWQQWWRQHKQGFVLPHEHSVKDATGAGAGATASYYDIPLVSSRIAFVVDVSGSMMQGVGTDRGRTRLTIAQEQLALAVGSMPGAHVVNLIPFNEQVQSLWPKARKLSKSNRADFLTVVGKLKAAGGTNTFGGVMRAFANPNIDTIYLLTDGVATAGELTAPDEIVDAILYENRTRQIVVHCISIGRESEMLEDIAAATGGEYKYVR